MKKDLYFSPSEICFSASAEENCIWTPSSKDSKSSRSSESLKSLEALLKSRRGHVPGVSVVYDVKEDKIYAYTEAQKPRGAPKSEDAVFMGRVEELDCVRFAHRRKGAYSGADLALELVKLSRKQQQAAMQAYQNYYSQPMLILKADMEYAKKVEDYMKQLRKSAAYGPKIINGSACTPK